MVGVPGVEVVVDVGVELVVVVVGVELVVAGGAVVDVDAPPATAITGAMGDAVGVVVVMPEGVTVSLG